jgi:uncharacterized lipoprotein YddW (UPF0748 family)
MNRKISILVLVIIMFSSLSGLNFAANAPENLNGVWIATVFNIDYPSTKNNIEAQKKEFIDKLEKLQSAGINTVVVQVRPKGDALYLSNINPWSDVLTGIQGKDPGYNPMTFMIKESHDRGMLFYAWLNPYRVTTKGTDVTKLSKNHPARINPALTISHKDALYYNPEKEGVKNHIVATVKEIIELYPVDGIVFDDYFYPSKYPLPEGEGKDGPVASMRRKHVNDMVYRVSKVIKDSEKNIVFGISPSGIWKNKKSDPTGSDTAGYESYYGVYADTRTWIKNEWIDFVSPQIYWQTGFKVADYETLVKWWSNEVKGTSVNLYISHCLYRDVVAQEIDKQLKINDKYEEVSGSIYYNMSNLLSDREGCMSALKEINKMKNQYTRPTLEGAQ